MDDIATKLLIDSEKRIGLIKEERSKMYAPIAASDMSDEYKAEFHNMVNKRFAPRIEAEHSFQGIIRHVYSFGGIPQPAPAHPGAVTFDELVAFLRKVAYEPVGSSDASDRQIMRAIENEARALCAKLEGPK